MKKIWLLCATLLHIGGVLETANGTLKVRLSSLEIGDSYHPTWNVVGERPMLNALVKNIPAEVPVSLKSVLASLEKERSITIRGGVATLEQQMILGSWISEMKQSSSLSLLNSVGISVKALLSAQVRQWLLQFTGISSEKYDDIIQDFSKISNGDEEMFADITSMHNWFVAEDEPHIDESCLVGRQLKDGVHVYSPKSTERIMRWWIQALMYATKLHQCFVPEHLGITHEVEMCVDGTDLPKVATDEPLLITAQTDQNYIGPMCVLLYSIQQTTHGEKGIIVSGDGLSEQTLRFLSLFNSENTHVHAENIEEDYLRKADDIKTMWARGSAFRIYSPQVIMEKKVWREWRWEKSPSRLLNIDTDAVVLKDLNCLNQIPNVDFAAMDLRYFYNIRGTKINLLAGIPGAYAITVPDDERSVSNVIPEYVTTFAPSTGRPSGGFYIQSLSEDPTKNSRLEKIALTLKKKRKEAYGDLFERVMRCSATQVPANMNLALATLGKLGERYRIGKSIDRNSVKYLTQDPSVCEIIDTIFNWIEEIPEKKTLRYNMFFLKPWRIANCQDMKTVTENVINPTEEECLHWLQLENGVTSIYLEPQFNMPLNFIYPCIAKTSFLRPTCDELERNHKALSVAGKNCVLLHLDNCLKPWNPEYFERCKGDYDAMLTFLYYAEHVRQTNNYLMQQMKTVSEADGSTIVMPIEWVSFVAKFAPYFSRTPEKVVEAFNGIDMEARLKTLIDGNVPQCSTGMMIRHLLRLGVSVKAFIGNAKGMSDEELLEACTKDID